MMSGSSSNMGIFDSAHFPEISDDRSSYTSPITEINQEIRRTNVAAAAASQGAQAQLQISVQDANSDPWESFLDGAEDNDDAYATPQYNGVGQQHEKHPGTVNNTASNGNSAATKNIAIADGDRTCVCTKLNEFRRASRRGSWANGPISPSRRRLSLTNVHVQSSSGEIGDNNENSEAATAAVVMCPTCGKKRPLDAAGFAWARPKLSGNDNGNNNSNNGNHNNNSHNLDGSTVLVEDPDEPQHAQALLHCTPQLRFLSPASTDMQGAGNVSLSYTSPHVLWSLVLSQVTGHGNGDNRQTNTSSSNNSNNTTASNNANKKTARDANGVVGGLSEYRASLVRDRANHHAAAELASLLWVLAHEMSLEDYGTVESSVFSSVFALVHESNKERRMAGLAALDALLAAPSADEEKKAIKFANTLSNGLRAADGDFEFLSALSKALGHMAERTANVDFVESEVTRALEWLRTERSDRRIAACLSLKELAIHAPTSFHSKTSQSTLGQGGSNEFLDHIFQAIRDPQPIVRACAADALSQCLKILVKRRHLSLTGLLCQVHFSVMEGLKADASRKRPWRAIAEAEASQHGSLLVVATMITYTQDFMLPRYEEVCRAVLGFIENSKALIRLEIVRLIPRLARRCPRVFGRRYLEPSLVFLIESASNPTPPRVGVDIQPSAFTAIGQLILAMTDEDTGLVIGGSTLPTVRILDDPDTPGEGHIVELCQRGIIYGKLPAIFALVREGLRPPSSTRSAGTSTLTPALNCAANLVEALGDLALPYITDLIDVMFRAGLSNDLIQSLHSIAQCVPAQQSQIEDRMLQEVSVCLAGMRDVYDPLASFRASALQARALQNVRNSYTTHDRVHATADSGTETTQVRINMADDPDTVRALALSLQTLASFGGLMGKVTTSGAVVPLLPFVQDVAAQYLSHPSSEVRRAAALTCCVLLVPHSSNLKDRIGSYSGVIIEDVLERLLRAAVSDPSPVVRLCVVRSLDSRYDSFLCQSHHLQELFLLLQDEALATRAAGLRLLGRLASINPAPILPVLRRLQNDLIVELQCGVDTGRGREEATRLLVVFLRAKSLQRLVHPVLPSLVSALPLDGAAPPRLASASLEALGELALATGVSLQPWVKEVVPHVLEIMQDQSSASKQRTSLRTLGQIAGSTGYVIRPYLDYPKLLAQATDVLPATKRAPWSLRREVIRTLGILGALDPDRYYAVASKTRIGGAVGGAYFEELDFKDIAKEAQVLPREATVTARSLSAQATSLAIPSVKQSTRTSDNQRKRAGSDLPQVPSEVDDDLPAYLFMYEQYAMVAQPVSSIPPAKRMSPSDVEFHPTVAIQALMRIFQEPALAVHHGMVIQAIMFIFKSLGLKCVPFLNKVVPHMIYTTRTCAPTTLRESLLKQLATLSLIVREHLRPYIADIFDVVEQFWSSRHLASIFTLVSNIAVGVPDEFRRFVPRLIQILLTTLDELQVAEWSTTEAGTPLLLNRGTVESQKLGLILKSVSNLRGVLGSYLHILVPALLKLADSLASVSASGDSILPESSLVELSALVYRTISALVESQNSSSNSLSVISAGNLRPVESKSSENGLPSRVVQPIVRVFRDKPPKNPTVGIAMIETLCVCARQIGGPKWVQLYDGVVRASIDGWQGRFPGALENDSSSSSLRVDDRLLASIQLYNEVVAELLLPPSERARAIAINNHRSNPTVGSEAYRYNRIASSNDFGAPGLTFDNVGDTFENPVSPTLHPSLQTGIRQKINQGSLQRAWDVSQLSSRDDWDEWMRRFAIQLLREAPSPSLRASASLAHAYQPLARELFSAAFACCWKELSERYQENLVHALETAFVADVSPEILQALLNLAEFMEHNPGGGLPIHISILADLALKCRAYAKALHYKEREYSLGGSNSCAEALISINRKLDLQEAALGVLKSSSLGEALTKDVSMGEELSTKFGRHQAYEMCYSVIWDNEEKAAAKDKPFDLMAKGESWLAKLGSWTEALAIYEEKLKRDPRDFEAMLGCMRCLIASGEWRKLLDLAEQNWSALSGPLSSDNAEVWKDISARSQRKALRMCSQAAWRLGQWDDLDKFSSELVGGQAETPFNTAATATTAGPSSRNSALPQVDFDSAFYTAVLHVHRKEWAHAADAIDAARKAMDGRLTALMAESYSRAYPSMVTAQTLAEMEEIVEFRKIEERSKVGAHQHPVNRPDEDKARQRLLSVWRERLAGCRVDAEVHSSILAVRSLVLGPADEVEATLALSELSRQAQRFKFAERVLLDPLEALNADLNGPMFGFGLSDSRGARLDFSGSNFASHRSFIDRVLIGDKATIMPSYGPPHEQWCKSLVTEAGGLERLMIQHRLYFAYVNHLWFTERRQEAMTRLRPLCDVVDMVSHFERVDDTSLRVNCWLELGEWKLSDVSSRSSFISDELQADVLAAFQRATLFEDCGYKPWHAWALLNFRIALQSSDGDEAGHVGEGRGTNAVSDKVLRNHVVAAVKGFVTAISLGTRKWCASVQQDLLNLLTCLFKYGDLKDVAAVINDCIGSIEIEAWLGVLPQLLARIHIKEPCIRSVLHPLLIRLGEKHPQALMYPLSVLLKSPVAERKSAAESLMNSLKAHSSEIVEEALMVSSELIRVAILWLETWHEGLEDASRLYFGEGNTSGMLDLLLPLHEKLERGPETQRESDFLKSFGQDLAQAHRHIKEYIRLVAEGGYNIPTRPGSSSGVVDLSRPSEEAETSINKAWDIYYTCFRRINKQLPSLTKLELTQCSPALSRARSLELGVPGSYRVDGSYVKIEKFVPSVDVITSKQRPRKITLRGRDGKDYVFLLKGHEDLRQDERVMQLFGLVNALLVRDPQTKKHDLKIQRYAISPLSHNCGLVGWVPNTETLHSLLRDFRSAKKIPLNMENREMVKISPDYDLLTVMQKVEVFTEALQKTSGQGSDLYEILWLKSTTSEEWLERRTKFTRSLAVMSIVGYILGLGDRHPSNLMLDKLSGRILHIDFGDCFEVAMNRDKYPEKVPFRLTRMLVKAMEVSGIEGSYRSTCERTMSVLRDSRDSLVAMLEAFVYDPLISWRLADLSPGGSERATSLHDAARPVRGGMPLSSNNDVSGVPIELSGRSMIPDPIREHPDEDGEDEDEQGNESVPEDMNGLPSLPQRRTVRDGGMSTSRARSLQMYKSIQTLAANLTTDSRITSVAGGDPDQHVAAEGSIASSRIERSMKQRELLSLLGGKDGAAHEEALNEKALKVIRRVQDKLTGTDFPDCNDEPLDVTDQVQRLVVQATSRENLCQLFIGWCAFW